MKKERFINLISLFINSPYNPPIEIIFIFNLKKVSFTLEKRNRDSQGRVPVFLRIRNDNSEKSTNSKVSVLEKDFKKGVIKTTVDNYTTKIKILNSLMEAIEGILVK